MKTAPPRRSPSGFAPVLRRELTGGWGVVIVLVGIELGLAWRFHAGTLRVAADAIGLLLGLLLMLSAPLAARRLLREAQAPAFLTTRPVTRRAALAAKGVATGLDLVLVGLAAGWLGEGLRRVAPSATFAGSAASLLLVMPLFFLWLGCIVFAAFSVYASRWTAGLMSALALLLVFWASAELDQGLLATRVEVIVAIALLPALALAAAAQRGTAWQGALR